MSTQKNNDDDKAFDSFYEFGAVLAMVISFTTHQSVLWAIIHGLFSWPYVIYFLITR